jgi:hypothetical protein
MNNLPRQMLRQILAKHGKEICGNARRCEGLLNDLCGAYRREINVLVLAIEERIPLDLLAGAKSLPPELLLSRLEKRLEEQTALTAEAARWAVESWALALGVVRDAEIDRRQKKQSDSPAKKAETTQPHESENKSINQSVSNINPANPIQPPKAQTPVPPSKTAPPANRQPTGMPQHLPPVYTPTNNQPLPRTPSVNPPLQPQNPAVVSRSRFGIFRGCLIIVFLLAVTTVVLFLGVPYAIEVMRETQRERNNEPPRFPAR